MTAHLAVGSSLGTCSSAGCFVRSSLSPASNVSLSLRMIFTLTCSLLVLRSRHWYTREKLPLPMLSKSRLFYEKRLSRTQLSDALLQSVAWLASNVREDRFQRSSGMATPSI